MQQLLIKLENMIFTLEKGSQYRYLEILSAIKQRLAYPDMKLAVIGNFSCGKSTFLNAMLKEPLLSMDLQPTTAIPTYIDWNEKGPQTTITIVDKTGEAHLLNANGRKWFKKVTRKSLPDARGEVIDYLTTNNFLSKYISKVQLSFQEEEGRNGFCLVDTPGVNPGDEDAKEHIVQTQSVLREEADAAIILFPSYQVYTKAFSDFLKENAKHLLADSIFIITKLDLIPNEKEKNKLFTFVKGQLRQNLGIEDATVYGCSAMYALSDFANKAQVKSVWTVQFEKMMQEIFEELQIRRQHIVAEKTKEMLTNLINELREQIENERQMLLESQKRFRKYTLSNLEKEYSRLFEPYRKNIYDIAHCFMEAFEEYTDESIEEVKKEVIGNLQDTHSVEEIRSYLNNGFKNTMDELEGNFKEEAVGASEALHEYMNEEYIDFSDKVEKLLKNYQYQVGNFQQFMDTHSVSDQDVSLALGESASLTSAKSIRMESMSYADRFLFSAFSLLLFNVGGWIVSQLALTVMFNRNKKKVIAQVESNLLNFRDEYIKHGEELTAAYTNRFLDAAGSLLQEYEDEYRSFFEKKERELKTAKRETEKKIERSEKCCLELEGCRILLENGKI